MKRPSLLEGIGLALLVSIIVALVLPVFSLLLAPGVVLRLLFAGLSLVYLSYLLVRSQQKLGRVTVLVCWFMVTIATWVFSASLLSYGVMHLLLIWLVRSLYFYNSSLSALADLALTGFALSAALWAWFSVGSFFLVFWCLFLVQALFVIIPRNFRGPRNFQEATVCAASASNFTGQPASDMAAEDPFEKAHAAAEQALRKLFATP